MKNHFILILLFSQYILFSQVEKRRIDFLDEENVLLEKEMEDYLSIDKGNEKIGTKFPFFVATDLEDRPFESSNTKPITVYNFWFSSCEPCIAELPMLNELKERYKDKVDFIAVTFENKEKIIEFTTKHPFNFKHVYLDKQEINDLEITFGYPTTVIVLNDEIISCKYGGPTQSSTYYKPLLKKMFEKFCNAIELSLSK